MVKIDIIGKMLDEYNELHEKYSAKWKAFIDVLVETIEAAKRKEPIDKLLHYGKEMKKEAENVLNEWYLKRIEIKKLFDSSEEMAEPNDIENRKLLKLIRDDKDPFVIKIDDRDEFVEDYFDEDYLVILNEEYDLENFLLRRIEAGRIISDRKIPRKFIRLFEKVKECYMFGLYEATIIFCRVLLEEALEDHIKKRDKIGYIRMEERKGFLEMLIDKSSLREKLKKEAHEKIRKPANKILHEANIKEYPITRIDVKSRGKKSFGVSAKMDQEIQQCALSSIRVVISIIEHLMNPVT